MKSAVAYNGMEKVKLVGFAASAAAAIDLVMNPTGVVVAVVWALAPGAASPAKERAMTAAMERVQIDEVVIEGELVVGLSRFSLAGARGN